jgi:hypothetical protein
MMEKDERVNCPTNVIPFSMRKLIGKTLSAAATDEELLVMVYDFNETPPCDCRIFDLHDLQDLLDFQVMYGGESSVQVLADCVFSVDNPKRKDATVHYQQMTCGDQSQPFFIRNERR